MCCGSGCVGDNPTDLGVRDAPDAEISAGIHGRVLAHPLRWTAAMQLATALPTKQQSFTPLPMPERNRLIEETITLVQSLAVELLRIHRFPIACEDLVSCGMRALVEAAVAFDSTRGVQFSTFAYWRVRGAMLDANRNGQGLCSRSEMSQMLREAGPTDGEPGTRRPGTRLQRLTYRAGDLTRLQARTDPEAATPESTAELASVRERVRAALAALAPRQRQVLELLYYQHEGSYEAVAKVLGVGRPHIFRIHARALTRLREHLSDLASH